MTTEDDSGSKTELPTEKKIRDTIEKGNTPFSREVTNIFSMCAIVLVAYAYSPVLAFSLSTELAGVLSNINDWPMDNPEDVLNLHLKIGGRIAILLVPFIVPILVFGMLASLVQNIPQLKLNRIQPKFDRISPAKGFKRMFGKQGFREFCKSLFKFTATGLVGSLIFLGLAEYTLTRLMAEAASIPSSLHKISSQTFLGLGVVVLFLAAADFVWVRREWFDDLKMSRQEIKDEMKQLEGDPMIRIRSRSVARERARKRMIEDVHKATVVITNPTHFAVALRYDPPEEPVPVVIAKGQDLIALKIREIAENSNISLIEDPPLARSLYKAVEVDMEIPEEFYLPIAKIISALSDGIPVINGAASIK